MDDMAEVSYSESLAWAANMPSATVPTTNRSAGIPATMVLDDDVQQLRGYLAELASDERQFGAATALLEYGRQFEPTNIKPRWLVMGEAKRCYQNAAAYVAVRDDVFYAEGYALNLEFPVPLEHAWLVDRDGKVIDPTWAEASHNVYVGIAFKPDFVNDVLAMRGAGEGVLQRLHILRKRYRDPQVLEDVLLGGMVPEMMSPAFHRSQISTR
jgi:hypothetical protein